MGWTVSVVSLVVFGSATLCVGIGFVAVRKRPDPMALPLAALMFAGVAWAVPHAISLGHANLGHAVFWHRIMYPGAVLVPVAYFVLAVKYAGHDRLLSPPVYVGLCLVPALTVVLVWTYPAHDLFWNSLALERVGGASVLAGSTGPWFWVNLGYSYLLIAIAWAVLASVAINSSPVYRKQAVLMLVGGIVPTALNVAFNLGLGPFPSVDLTTSALAVSGVAFAVALFRYDLLGLSPAAYRSVPELFGDGVLVFDDERRLIESNEPAERIFGTTLDVGLEADDLFESALERVDGTVVTTGNNGSRSYEARYAPLRDQRDDVVGHAVVMREITELKRHEQRLSVTNRVLRHNLRNELNVVLGEAQRLENLRDEETREAALDRLRDAARRLDDVGEKARHIQSSLAFDRSSLLEIDLVPVVESILDRHRTRYPNADISFESPGSAFVRASGTEPLEIVVDNLVENALEHNDGKQPSVEIGIENTGTTTRMRVADDGPGVPSTEYDVLEQDNETQLQHGSGLGLWLVYWFVSAMDGDLAFETNDPRGTVVTVQFETARQATASN